MNFRDYWLSLPEKQKQTYAKACGTSVTYIRNHYMSLTRRPTPDRLIKMIEETKGVVSRNEMITYFNGGYPYLGE